jgi:hypothetical protein
MRLLLDAIGDEPSTGQAQSPVAQKIERFAHLPHGWRYGEGGPIAGDVRETALQLHRRATALGLFRTDVVPSANGRIAFGVLFDQHFLEFVINPDLSIDLWHDLNGEEVASAEGLTLQQALRQLLEFAKQQWNSFGSSTQMTFIMPLDGSQAQPLKIRLMAQESRSFGTSASVSLDVESVSTSNDITAQSLGSYLSSGYFNARTFPKAAT